MTGDKYFIWLCSLEENISIELEEDDFETIYNIELEEVKHIKIISESGLKLKEVLEREINDCLWSYSIEQKIKLSNIIPIIEYEESPYGKYELQAYCAMADRINEAIINFRLLV